MFEKILIANRGEIACRVIRTARAMGIGTVAVYSEADRDARHVAMADEAVLIGPAPVAESYLVIPKIVAAARQTGAEAIHPGYGFLSENPDFVEAVEAAGLVFIGPSADAMRAMGLKDAAKALMEKAGVPVVPGYHGDNQDAAFLAAEADRIGYPVLIKAVAGGGGKGMRRVDGAAAFATSLASARAEAKAAFGNDAVLIEKYITAPRHIEVQVFGDGTKALHLFERECSLQRRHQKVIEEAPAPGMSEEARAAFTSAAVRAAEAIGYKGAGTIEFIADGSQGLRADGFWFMEMNTRLQVEHPVTEAITGVDLVEWQIRVAAGEPLPMSQDALQISGHAIEARLYAEDAQNGFLPATGRLARLSFPDDLRADSGVVAGDIITPHYDPMIAKLIAHAPDRDQALRRLRRGLQATQVAGTVTNLGFLQTLLADPLVVAGDLNTGVIDQNQEVLCAVPTPTGADWAAAALAALGLARPAAPEDGFSLWQPLTRRISFVYSSDKVEVAVSFHGSQALHCAINDQSVSLKRRADGTWGDDAGALPAAFLVQDTVWVMRHGGLRFTLCDPLVGSGESGGGETHLIRAPMPGLLRSLFAETGQQVTKGDRLAVLEAMKMEHALTAPRDAVIAAVDVRAGDQVEAGAILIRFAEDAVQEGSET